MLRTTMKSKVHRATVTGADLHYVGSVTVDADDKIRSLGQDPAETFDGPGLVRGDVVEH